MITRAYQSEESNPACVCRLGTIKTYSTRVTQAFSSADANSPPIICKIPAGVNYWLQWLYQNKHYWVSSSLSQHELTVCLRLWLFVELPVWYLVSYYLVHSAVLWLLLFVFPLLCLLHCPSVAVIRLPITLSIALPVSCCYSSTHYFVYCTPRQLLLFVYPLLCLLHCASVAVIRLPITLSIALPVRCCYSSTHYFVYCTARQLLLFVYPLLCLLHCPSVDVIHYPII